jgi:hypothetical protein
LSESFSGKGFFVSSAREKQGATRQERESVLCTLSSVF